MLDSQMNPSATRKYNLQEVSLFVFFKTLQHDIMSTGNLLIGKTRGAKAAKPSSHLAVIGDGLFVFVNYILGAEAVLGPSDLRAGVRIYAVGGESTCRQRKRKQSFAFSFLSLISLKSRGQEVRPKRMPKNSKPRPSLQISRWL